VARIKDHGLRDEYARRLGGLVGIDDPLRVVQRVRGMVRSGNRAESTPPPRPAENVDEAVVAVEREALKVALQLPAVAGPQFDSLDEAAFLLPAHRSLRAAITAAGGVSAAAGGPAWTAAVEQHLEEGLRSGVHALTVEPLRSGSDAQERYADAVLARMHEIVASRQVAAVKSRLQRINPLEQAEEHARLFGELIALESLRRGLRERAIGAP
jgi:DNA primase